ncbi:MAG: response regulator [Deltaproteobacteria bacterium]|nr:response regulator [Deltaproteobacteria bacterium]
MAGEKILLVDDDEIIFETAGQDLLTQGYHVYAALSGEEAVKELETGFFNLVITDLNMKETTGLDVLREAKRINPATMVMLLTAYGSLPTAVEALRQGASDYLLKPWQKEEMFFRVRGILKMQEMKNRLSHYENFLPVCCVCHNIRDDEGTLPGEGDWVSLEAFMKKKGGMDVTHTFCPECYANEIKRIP